MLLNSTHEFYLLSIILFDDLEIEIFAVEREKEKWKKIVATQPISWELNKQSALESREKLEIIFNYHVEWNQNHHSRYWY